MYLQCSVILNDHNGFVLGQLIMKNELDDDYNVKIMIEKYGNSLSFIWIFQTTF